MDRFMSTGINGRAMPGFGRPRPFICANCRGVQRRGYHTIEECADVLGPGSRTWRAAYGENPAS